MGVGQPTKGSTVLKGIALGVVIVTLSIVLNPIVWRVCCYKPYSQPSGSMEPGLLIGDYWFASTWAYWGAEPKRGDVVAFRHPHQANVDYVKRIVGLPGDAVQMSNGHVVLNGKELSYERIADYVEMDRFGNLRRIPRYRESLPDGGVYPVLDSDAASAGDNTSEFKVPAGHYFMLGDNRDNSSDSRFEGFNNIGMVPAGNIIGRADIVYFSLANGQSGDTAGTIRWSRLLKRID